MRDMRINRIFEGTSEIQHLFIAREAVDPHMKRGYKILQPETPTGEKLSAAAKAGAHYAAWYPSKYLGWSRYPKFSELGKLGHAHALRRAQLTASGAVDLSRHDAIPGQAGAEADGALPHRRHRHGPVRDGGLDQLRHDAGQEGQPERHGSRRRLLPRGGDAHRDELPLPLHRLRRRGVQARLEFPQGRVRLVQGPAGRAHDAEPASSWRKRTDPKSCQASALRAISHRPPETPEQCRQGYPRASRSRPASPESTRRTCSAARWRGRSRRWPRS